MAQSPKATIIVTILLFATKMTITAAVTSIKMATQTSRIVPLSTTTTTTTTTTRWNNRVLCYSSPFSVNKQLLVPTIIRNNNSSKRKSSSFSSFCGHAKLHIQTSPPKPSPQTKYHQHSYSTLKRTTPKMMPEGPEVRTLVDQLQPAVGMRLLDIQFTSGRYVKHDKPRGFGEFGQTMSKYYSDATKEKGEMVDVITKWDAKGKFLYFTLDNGGKKVVVEGKKEDEDYLRSVWITLGMTGKFVSESAQSSSSSSSSTDQAKNGPRWNLSLLNTTTNAITNIYYHDTRNFGTLRFSLSKQELDDKLDSLGLDILKVGETTVDVFLDLVERQRSKKRNICKFLMDQSKLSGVGNYILAESLYRANIDPYCNLNELNQTQLSTLFHEIQSIATNSYNAQGLTRAQGGSYRTVDGQKGSYEFQLQCYGRETCGQRGDVVLKDVNGPHGRTIWYTERQLFVPRDRRSPVDGSILIDDDDKEVMESNDKNTGTVVGDDATAATTILANGIQDEGWKEALLEYMATSTQFQNLADFLVQEKKEGKTIYPPEKDIFAALNLCPMDKAKVVIIGQDPYHGFGQGHGLAFSVRKGVRPPPSLVNIFKEAIIDVGIEQPTHGNLEYWAKQGVLLLNSVLTVREGQANSHAKKGWEEFTDKIVEILNDDNNQLVFLLWGGPAARKASAVDESKHTVIRTSHPSPLGATKTNSPFLGSRCFSRTNEALENAGKEPIDWNVY